MRDSAANRRGRVWRSLARWTLRLSVLVLVALAGFLGARAWYARLMPPLERWHTFVPSEPDATTLEHLDWQGWLEAETRVMAEVEREVVRDGPSEGPAPLDRYVRSSPIWPGRFARDWNRSYLLEPEGAPEGAVVLLHGLTDAPYSLRHIARFYRDRGWLALGLRLPGHGTVPAALTAVEVEDWTAATRMAVRAARARLGADRPLHLVGFSNGGALALQYALDALEDPALVPPDRLVLLTPMIGITEFARFAGIAGWPALLPAFAEAAWLAVVPEFNPFKYNSFPVNGAVQSHRLTRLLRAQLRRLATTGVLERMPPVLTIQSAVDFTVSARAIVEELYGVLPVSRHELVLIDVNRAGKLGPLLNPAARRALDRLLPSPPRAWRSIVVTSVGPDDPNAVARIVEPGSTEEQVRPLSIPWPRELHSLSHVALPFPTSDALYGSAPDGGEDFGIELGTVAARGEVGVLITPLDALLRASWNPFFPYLLERIAAGIDDPAPHRARGDSRSRIERRRQE